jgi:hypothetical protein
MFRQSLNAQRKELTAISTRIFSNLSAGQFTGKKSRDTRAINDIESSNTTHEDRDTAGPALYQPIQRTSKSKGRNTASLQLRLPNLFLNPVWEFSVYKANQGWDFSFRSYNIRPNNAQIFEAILNGDLSQVCELLHSGRASIWDRDPSGKGVLHFAARSCGDHGSAVIEYLVKSGADIYGVDSNGFPPYFSFLDSGLHYVDEQTDLRLAAGYKVFTSHRDWIASRPSTRVPWENFKATSDIIDVFPIFMNPPERIICSVLHEMWPPWKDMPPADRIKTLFPEFDVQTLTGAVSPLSMRACLSREVIQETFADWDTKEKAKLIQYAFDALSEQLALSLEKGIEEARLFLKDMHMTNSLMDTLPEVDPLRLFVHRYAAEKLTGRKWRRWRVERYINAAQEGLNHYISELMLLGIDMATVIDIERKVIARYEEESFPRRIYWLGERYKIIAIDYGLGADDSYLWLSNPLDEWTGEFWDMIDHPERAIPGAWKEE